MLLTFLCFECDPCASFAIFLFFFFVRQRLWAQGEGQSRNGKHSLVVKIVNPWCDDALEIDPNSLGTNTNLW